MLPEADRAAVARALAKDPDERFPSCTAFVRALGGRLAAGGRDGRAGHHAVETAGPDQRPPTGDRRGPGHRRDRAAVGAVAAGDAAARHRQRRGPVPRPARPARTPLSVSVSIRPEEGVLRPTVLIGVGSASAGGRCNRSAAGWSTASATWPRCRASASCTWTATRTRCAKAVSGPPDAALVAGRGLPRPAPAGHRVPPPAARPDPRLAAAGEAVLDPAEPAGERVAGAGPAGVLRQLPAVRDPAAARDPGRHPPGGAHASRPTRPGCTVRDKVPAVYVFASATGGTGGMLVDLGYAVRRVLARINIAGRAGHRVRVRRRPGRPGQPAGGTGQHLRHPHRAEPLRRPGRDVRRPVRRAGGAAGRGPRAAVHRDVPAADGRAGRRRRSATASRTWPGTSPTT